jgi:hypothetical protein
MTAAVLGHVETVACHVNAEKGIGASFLHLGHGTIA